ncbi:hypothetical protein BJX76DRAFT_353997 [Aspergillus varians]
MAVEMPETKRQLDAYAQPASDRSSSSPEHNVVDDRGSSCIQDLEGDDGCAVSVGHVGSARWRDQLVEMASIICAVLTFLIFVQLLIFLPTSPLDAKRLSVDKVHTIEITRETHVGITNSIFKWSQVRESFTDFKSWLFMLVFFLDRLKYLKLYIQPADVLQRTPEQHLAATTAHHRGLTAPWDNKVALVVGTQISTFKPSYLLGLNWAGVTTTGHTKKITLLTSCIVAASVVNMILPEFWESKYQPCYVHPWAFMTAFWFIYLAMCIIIRFYLQHENKKRAALLGESALELEDEVYEIDTGNEIMKIWDRDLDRTDRVPGVGA